MGKTVFKGCQSGLLSTSIQNEALIIKKKHTLDSEKSFISTETISFEDDLLQWELSILSEGNSPWSVPIRTIWSMSGSDLTYWTTWGDPRPESSVSGLSEKTTKELLNGTTLSTAKNLPVYEWEDPLQLQPLFPRKLMYGGSIYGHRKEDQFADPEIYYSPANARNYFSVPIIGLYKEKLDIGVSLGFSPENIGIEAELEITDSGQLVFSRYNNRFVPGEELRFTTYLKLHEADWRASLGWYVKRFKKWFDPINRKVHEFSGTSSYSSETGPFDVQKMIQMGFKTNWDATFSFPYMGLFLPPVEKNEGWLTWRGEYMTFKKLDDYYARMQKKGFHVLSYFNVTEFGNNILRKEDFVNRHETRKPWIDCNKYLHDVLEPAVLYHPKDTTYTKHIYTWERSIVMDPAEPVFKAHLVGQINNYLERLPHFEGITIDRIDWTRMYNTRRDDGTSWFQGKPARSLHNSWKNIMDTIAPILHNKDKVIFINNHIKRLEDLEQVDGIFDEFGYMAASINANAILCVNKPLLGWCRDRKTMGSDLDAYMQKYLHLGMYPMAPFPGNDHALLPDAEVDRLYLDYGGLFKTLKGKNWILEPGLVSIIGDKAKVNIFDTQVGTIIPVTFGKDNQVRLRIKNIPKNATLEYLHPGDSVWKKIKTKRNTIKLPLYRGCAIVRIN